MNKLRQIIRAVRQATDKRTALIYIIEGANWSTDRDGENITKNIQKIRAKTDCGFDNYKNKIVHLGSLPVFNKIKQTDKSNRVVQTIFHVAEEYVPTIQKIKNSLNEISFIHTASQGTKNKLTALGLPENKIAVIPLGIDLNIFNSVTVDEKKSIRKKLDLPQDKIIVGSFQKDGNGWGEGLTPKLIKGPDIFCDAVIELAKKFPIHILLTGPARGYVKTRLAEGNVPYTHKYLKNYTDTVPYWQALDVYLITSRLEGGPKAILEAWAAGVPLVSTKVGMVPDIAMHGENAILTEVEDTKAIIAGAEQILNNRELKNKLIAKGLEEVQKYSWEKIAERYFQELYQPIMK